MPVGGIRAMRPSAGVRVVLHSHEAVPQMPGSHHREAAPERREAGGLGSDAACAAASSHDSPLELERGLRRQQGTGPRAREDGALLGGTAVPQYYITVFEIACTLFKFEKTSYRVK